jgi:hypothetical protein
MRAAAQTQRVAGRRLDDPKALQEVIMIQTNSPHDASPQFELRFASLFGKGPSLCFPCDAEGSVILDALSDRARHNYLFARALMGRDYGAPHVLRRLAPCVPSPQALA